MSLKNKILISFISVIFLVFTPLVFFMQTKVKDTNRAQISQQVMDLSTSKVNEIDLWIKQRVGEIELIKEFDEVKTMDIEKIPALVERINKSFNINNKRSDETFAIGTTNGLGYIGEDLYIDVSKREYFQEVLKNESKYVISEPVISRSDNQPIFLISSPIIDDNNDMLGFINGSVSLMTITNVANEINLYDSVSWIMNNNNHIYASEASGVSNMYSDSEVLRLIQEDIKVNDSGIINFIDENNQSQSIFYNKINSAEDWILCTIISDKSIDAQTDSITKIIINASIVFIIIFIFLTLIISNSIVKPIFQLKSKMELVSKGQLNAYVDVKGNDEISKLGKYFNIMVADIQKLLTKSKEDEKQKREAELKSLQSQINPHFLYNTLDTLQWKALEENNEYVADMVNMLSRYFRIVLSSGEDLISLKEEIDHVYYYLKIQEIRYKDILSYTIDIDESLLEEKLPKLIIQPLVENSIYHGLKLKRSPGLIKVKVIDKDDYIQIVVFDDGLGIKEDNLVKLRNDLANSIETNHYGLYNINERLRLYYKEAYDLKIDSIYKQYTEITITILKKRGEY